MSNRNIEKEKEKERIVCALDPRLYEDEFFYLPNSFVDNMSCLSSGSVAVYLFYEYNRAINKDKTYFTYKEIMNGTGIKSKTTIRKAIVELSEKGYINKLKENYQGYVYLIESQGYYKIGKAKNFTQRTKHLDTIMPIDTTLIYSFHSQDYTNAEKTLHNKYKHLRHKGEWFALTEQEINEIMSIKDDTI
jgi:hypothetical protein